MRTTFVPTAAAEVGGAPVRDILIVGGSISVLTILTLALVLSYRRGDARGLRQVEGVVERVLGIPGWAAIPSIAAIGSALLAFAGGFWDIGVHIDIGRDEGPLGTVAHYPFMFGLIGLFLSGVLAVGMTPTDRSASSAAGVDVPGFGRVSAAALLLAAGGSFALLGFPLDDLWHRLFGQDVTLWGPTHVMFFGGGLAGAFGATLLLVEGARAAGKEPFTGVGLWSRPLPLVAGILGGMLLFIGTHATDEFNWAVPQYRMIWQPILLVFFSTAGLVAARMLTARGGALLALAIYLPIQVLLATLIGGPLERTPPAYPLFIAEALLVEAVAFRASPRQALRVGIVAGALVGTVGFWAEYGWSHIAMPLPWQPGLLPEAIPAALLAGVSGGVLAAMLVHALRGTLGIVRRPLAVSVLAAACAVALAANAAVLDAPKGVTAAMQLSNVREVPDAAGGGPTTVADLAVRINRTDLTENPAWLYVLGWQGGGRFENRLVDRGDGWLRSTAPVPIGGTWKTFVRVHKGRTTLAVPVRMPADPELDFAGFPARETVTRDFARDTTFFQVERRDDAPRWAWTPASILVLSLNIFLMVLVAVAAVRIGKLGGANEDDDSSSATNNQPTPVAPVRWEAAAGAPAGSR